MCRELEALGGYCLAQSTGHHYPPKISAPLQFHTRLNTHVYIYIYIYNINYSHSVIRVHTVFICVLVYYTSYFLQPTDSSQTCQFPLTGRQEHIQDVIESTTGPTSKWCKDVAKLLKCPLAQDGRVSQHLISPINGGFNREIIYKW